MTTVLGDSSGSKKFKSDRNLNLIRRNRCKFLIMQSHISVSSKKDRLNLKLKTTFIWVRLQSCPEGWRSKLNVSWNWKRNTWLKRKTVRQVISFRMLKVSRVHAVLDHTWWPELIQTPFAQPPLDLLTQQLLSSGLKSNAEKLIDTSERRK